MTDRVLHDPALAPALAEAGFASADALLTLGGDAHAPHVVRVIEVPVKGTTGVFHLKRYHYPGWRKSRGLIGRGTLWGRAPEMNEFLALARLRALDIGAVRPVAAASRTRRGRLVAHALLTEHEPDAVDLATRLDTPGDPVACDVDTRRRVLRALGRALSRMHAASFVHRDCHARNVLVHAEGGDGVGLVFLDCRRGGRSSLRHPALFDLATLDADLEGRVPASDRARALRAWLPAGARPRRTHERVVRVRERLKARDRRRGRPRR